MVPSWFWKLWVTSPQSKTPGKASEVLGSLKSKLAVATESNSVFEVELCLQANFSGHNGAFQRFQLNLVHTYIHARHLSYHSFHEGIFPAPNLFKFQSSTFNSSIFSHCTLPYSPIQHTSLYLLYSTTLFRKDLRFSKLSLWEQNSHFILWDSDIYLL